MNISFLWDLVMDVRLFYDTNINKLILFDRISLNVAVIALKSHCFPQI